HVSRGFILPGLRAVDDVGSQRSLDEPEEFPSFPVSQRPFCGVSIALVIEAPLVIFMEMRLRKFRACHEQQRTVEMRKVPLNFAVARLELADDLLIQVLQQALARIEHLPVDLGLKLRLQRVELRVNRVLVSCFLHDFEYAALDVDATLDYPQYLVARPEHS